jgi:hypothetical protein
VAELAPAHLRQPCLRELASGLAAESQPHARRTRPVGRGNLEPLRAENRKETKGVVSTLIGATRCVPSWALAVVTRGWSSCVLSDLGI